MAYKMHPNFSRANQEKDFVKQSTNIKYDEINIMNIINDKTSNLNNSFLNKDNRYMKVTLKSGLMSCVFANGLGDWGSIPGRVIPKAQKMVLDASLLNTQHYKVCIKGKVEQSREWRSTLSNISVL